MAPRHPNTVPREADGIDYADSPLMIGGDRTSATKPPKYSNRLQLYARRGADGKLELYVLDEDGNESKLTTEGSDLAAELSIEIIGRGLADEQEATLRNAAIATQAATTLSAAETYTDSQVSAASGELVLIEQKTLVSQATDVTFSGLNGDADATYVFHIVMLSQVFGMTAFLRPNGDSTGGLTNYVRSKASGVTSGSDPSFFLGGRENGGGSVDIEGVFDARRLGSAKPRIYIGHCVESYTEITRYDVGSSWSNGTDNITSLTFHSDVANGFAGGSIFSLYKRKHG